MSTPTTGIIQVTAGAKSATFNGERWKLVSAGEGADEWDKAYARGWVTRLNEQTPRFTGQHIPAELAARRVLDYVSPEAKIVDAVWDRWPEQPPAPVGLID